MRELTAEIAHELLRYEPETGKLFWRKRDVKWFNETKRSAKHTCNNWNAKFAGKEAFTLHNFGYRHGKLFKTTIYAHRIIWLMQTSAWPKHHIDHINGIPSDNRWSNLRSVSQVKNARNKRRQKNNTSGVCGVYWVKSSRRWRAKICLDGRLHCLGCFVKKSDAINARKADEKENGFHKNHGKLR